MDRRLAVTYVNPAAEQLLGVSRLQLQGRRASTVVPGLQGLDPLLERCASGEQGLSRRELAVDLDPTASRTVHVDCAVTPVEAPDGSRTVLVELSSADWRMRMSREARLLGQLATTRAIMRQLAHEVRNPLGGIRGAAQLLERQLPRGELSEYTDVIIREADRLADLAGGFLAPSDPPAREELNVHEVLEHVRRLIVAEHSATVMVIRDYDPSLPELNVDRNQIIQAMMNLARNGVRAAGPGGRLILRTRAVNNRSIGHRLHRVVASVEIEDDGPGVPEELRDTLFYPLVTGRNGGTGLGLAIAQELVSRHGGLIEFVSRPGRTVFAMLFPIDENEMPRKHAPPSP